MNKNVFIVSLVLVLVLIGCSTSNASKNESSSTYAFAILNKSQQYVLYNSEGKQLGDAYESSSNFDEGTALLKNDKGEVGLINTAGKLVAPFGKYERINKEGYLYVATDKDKKSYLLSPSGKVIEKLDSYQIYPYGIVTVEYDDQIIAYDEEGKKLVTFPMSEEAHVKSNVTINEKEKIGMVTDGKKVYIIDMNTKKEIDTFESDVQYKNIAVLYNWYVLQGEDNVFKVYKNQKEVGVIKDECKTLTVHVEVIECKDKEGNSYLLDDQLNKDLLLKLDKEILYQNSKNYALGNLKEVAFYENGQEVNKLTGLSLFANTSISPFGVYPLTNGKNSTQLYNGKGELLSQTSFSFVDSYNEHGYARVKADGVEYLIDSKGEKVSEDFKKLSVLSEGERTQFYIGEYDQGSVVYDSSFKEIYRGDIVSAYARYNIANEAIVSGYDKDKNMIVYNASKAVEVFRGEGKLFGGYEYFSIENQGLVSYYSYNGYKLFEE